VDHKDLSPGVRRMLALVGQAAPFDHGRAQMKLLAGLEVTTKAVERTAEAIGSDIAAQEQKHIQQSTQLYLPVLVGEPIPIFYIQMDGTGIPVTGAERRKGKVEGQPAHTREVKLGCIFTQNHLGPGWLRPPRSGLDHLYRSHRDRSRIRPTPLLPSPESRLAPSPQESNYGRWGRVDMEPR
jgi:hypothetical protein